MIPFHRYAEMFPLLAGPEFDELVDDVRRRGIHLKIKHFEDAILDGRNRYRAGVAAGIIDPEASIDDLPSLCERFVPELDGDPIDYVWSLNVPRRHLDKGQIAYSLALREQYRHGGARKSADNQDANLQLENGSTASAPTETRAELAEKGGVSERSIASAAVVRDRGVTELKDAVRDGQIPIYAAERIARLPTEQQPAAVAAETLPHGARAIMASRKEPDDSLDYFPTPPWATRALIERVLWERLGLDRDPRMTVWEPACGENHIAQPLSEYGYGVFATDIFDYGKHQDGAFDFLAPETYPAEIAARRFDWIITNPPFGDKTEPFVLRAIELASVGVAMFVRLQWLETTGRYENVFRDHPPTLIAFFAERVNLCKGRWEPDGSTATAYIWLVWIKASAPQAPFWIPPGQREALTRPTDRARFAKHTLPSDADGNLLAHDQTTGEIFETAEPAPSSRDTCAGSSIPIADAASMAPAEPAGAFLSPPAPAPAGSPSADLKDDGLDIPAFLRRRPE